MNQTKNIQQEFELHYFILNFQQPKILIRQRIDIKHLII